MGHGRLLRLLPILHAIPIFDRLDLLRVAEHTVLAAEAFEMVHNLIQDWASTRPSIASRNSFSLGVAYRVRQIAKKKNHNTEKAARDNERKAALEKVRLKAIEL